MPAADVNAARGGGSVRRKTGEVRRAEPDGIAARWFAAVHRRQSQLNAEVDGREMIWQPFGRSDRRIRPGLDVSRADAVMVAIPVCRVRVAAASLRKLNRH